jgi:hypothetical protein
MRAFVAHITGSYIMQPFSINRSLLNPKFEGYKLDPIKPADDVACYELEYKPSQVAISARSPYPLSFHEVQSRITHNHLAVVADAARALYVDSEYKVIVIDVDKASAVRHLFSGPLTEARFAGESRAGDSRRT